MVRQLAMASYVVELVVASPGLFEAVCSVAQGHIYSDIVLEM